MQIAVFGATGQLGGLVLDELVQRGVDPADVVALGRDEERLGAIGARGFRIAAVDLGDPTTLRAPLDGVEDVLLVSGSELGARVAQHRNAVEAARSAGARRIVYTSAPRATTTRLVLAAEHKATEELLAESGLATTVLRNNWYHENHRADLERAAQTGVLVNSVGAGRIASAPRVDYAAAAAVVLTSGGHDGAVYELGGDIAWTWTDFAADAAEVLGRSVEYRASTPDEEAETLRASGADDGTVAFVQALNADIREGALDVVTGDLSSLIGRPVTPLIESMRTWRTSASASA